MNALWMRVVANIGNRKVTWRAVMSLGLPRAAAVGHLVMLWGGALEAETNGYVDDIPDAQLEAWACWDGEPGTFAAFIREHHVTDGRINDWEDYAGVLEAQRERERTKKATQRSARKQGTSAGIPHDTARDVPGDVPGNSPHKERKGKERKRAVRTAAVAAPRTDRDHEPAGFADAMAAYPTRSGGNPRDRARRAYAARLHEGATPAEILAGVQRYADWCAATEKIGTELVQQAATFFGPSRAYAEPWTVPAPKPRIVPNGAPIGVDDPLSPAALRVRFAEFGLMRFGGDRPAYAAKVKQACPMGVDAPAWDDLVRRVQPWTLNEITFPPEVERTIAARLANAPVGAGAAA